MSNPRVSVVIPAYNRAKMTLDAIESVRAQTYRDFEIIVVDDGSKDGTAEMITERYGDKVNCLRQENKGVASARNQGLRAARGELIALLDSDDMYLPDFLEEAVAFLDAEPELALVFSDTEKVSATGQRLPSFFKGKKIEAIPFTEGPGGRRTFRRKIFSELVGGSFIPCSAVMVRARCFREVGFFREEFRACEDLDMWLRFDEKYPMGYLNKVLATVRVQDDNLTGKGLSDLFYHNKIRVTENVLATRRGATAQEEAQVKRILGDLHFSVGWKHFSEYRLDEARGDFLASIRNGRVTARNFAYVLACCMPTPLIKRLREIKAEKAPG